MTTTYANTDLITEIPCPSWCRTDHSDIPPGQGFHASAGHRVETAGPLIRAPAHPPAVFEIR